MSDEAPSTLRHAKALRVLFWFGIAFTAVAPVVTGLFDDTKALTWPSLIVGAFLTIISKIENLSEFSLGPLKAKLREQLNEAAATTSQLRALGTKITATVLHDLAENQFIDGMKLGRRLERHDSLIEALKSIGATQEQVDFAEAGWRSGMGKVYYNHVRHCLQEYYKRRGDPGGYQTNLRTIYEGLYDVKNGLVATSKELRDFIKSTAIEDKEVNEWISDYKHYVDTNEIRRIDDFLDDHI